MSEKARSINIGKWVDYAGDVWKVIGINYLGDYDLERLEQRPDGNYRVGGSCVFGLPESHPHYAVIVDDEWMAEEIGRLRRIVANPHTAATERDG